MIPHETEDTVGPTVISQSGRICQDWLVLHSDKFIAGTDVRIISCWKTWLISWAELADGLCGILSCGLYTPDASTAVRIWALHNAATRAIPDQDDTESAVASEH